MKKKSNEELNISASCSLRSWYIPFSEFQTRHFKLEKIASSTRECQKSSADRKIDTPIKIFWEKKPVFSCLSLRFIELEFIIEHVSDKVNKK